MQSWRARKNRTWKELPRDRPRSDTQNSKTSRSVKFTRNVLWLDACNKLGEILNSEKGKDATEFITLLQSNVDNETKTAIGDFSVARSHEAGHVKRAKDGNGDGKTSPIAQLPQALTGNDSSILAGQFLASVSSHKSSDQGCGADSGTLQANSTSHNDHVHSFAPGKVRPAVSLCQPHHDKGHGANAGNTPCTAALYRAQDNNGHGANAKEHSAIIVSCQSQNNNVYGVATWTLLSLEDALNALENGAQPCPSFEDVACLLRKCGSSRNQEYALRLHAYMRQNGLDSEGTLGNHLVSMLADVGCMQDAQQTFDRLVYRNKLSWDSLITGHIKQGNLYDALSLYWKVSKDDSFCCSSSTFVLLLKACAQLKDLNTGTALHAKVAKLGLHVRDGFVANSLVDMYAKCGSFEKGRCVLEGLRIRDVIAWTALITGYANHGLAEKALKCFERMQLEGVILDKVIVVCILRACGSLGAVDKVQEIHTEIERIGLLEKDVAIGTILIEIYASCNLLSRAQQVFDKLHNRDVIVWTALILGYSEHGHCKEALKCFDQMQCEGICPDSVTLICILKACSSLGALDRIQRIHVQIEREGLLAQDDVAGSVLVDVYGKCGDLEKALHVFNQLHSRGVVPWTALIEGYSEHGHGEEGLQCFEQMQIEGVPLSAITFSCSLKACGSVGAIIQGQKIHLQVEGRCLLKKNLIVGNALVDMYTKCGSLDKARQVFDKLPLQNVVSWTSLIAGYAEHGHGDTALECFDQMQLEGVSPNAVTFTLCLKACGSTGAIDKGGEIHAQIANNALLKKDAMVGDSLIDMYARFGMFAKAQQVFDKLPNQTVVSWTSLIARLAEHGHVEEALDCFEQMQRKCVYPNDVTFITLLKVCGSIGALDKVQELHTEVERLDLLASELVGNTLVFVYSKCGLLALAQDVFEELPVRDVVSWNSLIAGYTQLGEAQHAFSMFERMVGEGIRPGSATFTTVLSACNRQGLLNKSQTFFQGLSEVYGIILTPEHQCSMLESFCRAGEFDKAKALIQAMENCSSVVMWHSLLGACKNFLNVEFGKWAFSHALHLDVQDAASYALMCQVYGISNTQGEKCSQVDKITLENILPLQACC